MFPVRKPIGLKIGISFYPKCIKLNILAFIVLVQHKRIKVSINEKLLVTRVTIREDNLWFIMDRKLPLKSIHVSDTESDASLQWKLLSVSLEVR